MLHRSIAHDHKKGIKKIPEEVAEWSVNSCPAQEVWVPQAG